MRSRLDKALELGAHSAIDAREVDAVAEVRKLTDGGADGVAICTRGGDVLNQAIEMCKNGSRIVIAGALPTTTIEPRQLVAKWLTVMGVLGGRWGIRRVMIAGVVLSTVGRGLLPLAELLPATIQSGWIVAAFALGNLGTATWVVSFAPYLIGATGGEERDHVFSVFFALVSLFSFFRLLYSKSLHMLCFVEFFYPISVKLSIWVAFHV